MEDEKIIRTAFLENRIFTRIIRVKKLAVFVGARRALAMAVKSQDISKRQTALQEILSP